MFSKKQVHLEMVYNLTSENNTMTLLYLYSGSGWWKEKKKSLVSTVCTCV